MDHCKSWLIIPGICLALALTTLTGCTPDQASETLTALQNGLTALSENRSLAEQFVRDIKTNVDPKDPAYREAMESYEEARDSYNQFLDNVELASKSSHPSTNLFPVMEEAQNSTADFLEGATRILKPEANTRRVHFNRAVVLPDNLAEHLHQLPKHDREVLVDKFDKQVRWRSWRQL